MSINARLPHSGPPLLRRLAFAASLSGVCVAALFAPLPALAQAPDNTKVSDFSKSGHWTIVSVRRGTAFSHCSAGAKYKSGTRVGIVALANGQWRLSFYHDDWPERTGQKFNARLVVDGREVLASAGQFNKKSALIDLGTTADRVKALMKGQVMSIETPSGKSSFRLDGTNAATGEVARCWTANARNSAEGGGAFGAPSQGGSSGGAFGSAPPATGGAFGGGSTSGGGSTKLSRADTMELATRYLGKSAVPYEILPAERNVMKHFPINWRYRSGAIGGMMAVRGITTTTDDMLGKLLAEQTGYCKGSTASQRDQTSANNGATLSRGASICSTGGSVLRTAFSVWKASDNMMMIVIEAGVQSGSQPAPNAGSAPNDPARQPAPVGPKPNEI